MSNARTLHDAEKAAKEALSLLSNLESVYREIEACPWKLSRNSDYISYNAMRESTLPECEDQVVRIKQGVDCVNVAIFTNAIMWSNNGHHEEGISLFFQLLVPKQLHNREEIMVIFLDMVAIWAFAETRWPIGKLSFQDVISKMEGRIRIVLKDEDPVLCQKILGAFNRRYEQLDPMPWDMLDDMVNPKHLKEAWFKVLPTVLDAIDNKEVDHQQAEQSGGDNDHDGRFSVENDDSIHSFDTTSEGSVKKEDLYELHDDYDESEQDTAVNKHHHHQSDVPESREGEQHQQNEDSGELFDTPFDSWHQAGNVESGSPEDTHGVQHREKDFHVERVVPSQTTTEPVEQHLTEVESEPHDAVDDDDQSNNSNHDDDEDTTGWGIQGSSQGDFDASPMNDDFPSKRYHYDRVQRMAAAAASFNFRMDNIFSPVDADHTVLNPTQEGGSQSANQSDHRETSNESHAGMKRPHYPEEDQAEPRYRREPTFISEIFGDDEASQGAPDDSRSEIAYDDGSSNADIEDINPLTPSQHSCVRQRSTTSPRIVNVPHFKMLGSFCNHANVNDRPQDDDDDHNVHTKTRENEEDHNDNDHRMTNFHSIPPIKTENEAIDARQHGDNEMENGNTTTSQQRQTLRHDLAYTIHYGPESPGDHPAPSTAANYTTHNGERDGHTQQQALFDFGKTTRQQDGHTNNLLSTSVIESPVTPRRRRRRHHDDIGPIIASTRPRRNNVAYTFPPMGLTFRRWTTEEVKALDDGIKTYGRQWGRIIAEYSILRNNKTKRQASRKARYIAQQKRLKGLPLEHYEGCG